MSLSKKDLFQVSSYTRRLRDNVKSILDNYSEILKASKVNVEGQQGERVTEAQVAHVENEIAVRAANIVRAAEALSKLVSDIKESLILNDFSTINEVTSQRIEELQQQTSQQQRELVEVYASMSKEMREPTNQLTEDSGGQSNTTMTSNITSNITTTNVV